MARRRFFVDRIAEGAAELVGEDAEHLTRVLRVEPGQQFEISDDRGVWLAEIAGVDKRRVRFRLLNAIEPEPAGVRTVLLASLIKFDRFEWMIEKATELGVDAIVPVKALRSEKGLEAAAVKRVERWRKIARESSQQSRRAHLPRIAAPADLAAAMDEPATHRVYLEEAGAAPRIVNAVPAERSVSDTVAILVGPEGGWTDSERLQLSASAFTAVSLGTGILRAETAAIAALAVVSQLW